MKVIGVIPARWASSRLDGKVLADIAGKPMIQHVWEQAGKSRLLDQVIIACDQDHVYQAVEAFGGQAVMTRVDHCSGTDRVAEAVSEFDVDLVVNIQGDEPLIHPQVIDDLVQCLMGDQECQMATAVKSIKQPDELGNPNVVKVVIDENQYALYFSRSIIPFYRDKISFEEKRYFKHFGVYAYRKDFLLTFQKLKSTFLENAERLEQLRILESGYRIKTVYTEYDSIGVDTHEDLQRVVQILTQRNHASENG